MDYENDVGSVETPVPFFAVCGQKFTRLSICVHCAGEIAVCKAVFLFNESQRYLVPFRRYPRSNCEIVRNRAQILMFWAANLLGGAQISDQIFVNLAIVEHV